MRAEFPNYVISKFCVIEELREGTKRLSLKYLKLQNFGHLELCSVKN